MSATADDLANLADLLDTDDVFDLVAGAISDARDRKARHPKDADSGQVLEHVIEIVRAAAKSAS